VEEDPVTEPTTFKQPYEDIVGIDRDNWLLSLDMRAVAHRDALRVLAHHLHTACLVGNPAPNVQRMYERITRPQVGDLVVEISSFYRRRSLGDDAWLDHRTKALGILLEHRREWWQTDEEWQREITEDPDLADDGRVTDDAWYVQYGQAAADVCRWTNCDFIVVPMDSDEFRKPVGHHDGNGVTLTRSDLLGALADSGFALKDPGGS